MFRIMVSASLSSKLHLISLLHQQVLKATNLKSCLGNPDRIPEEYVSLACSASNMMCQYTYCQDLQWSNDPLHTYPLMKSMVRCA